MSCDATNEYTEMFFAEQGDGSVASAEVIVPIVLSLFPCASVIDVGCGVGGWLRVFQRNGVSDILGIDGDYVPRDMLKIPRERFKATDLRMLPDLGQFDIACSVEVAEHLPENCADQFVAALVAAAPVVVFSAAIPHQGGTSHLNEQWQSHWARKFARHGYVAVDCIRPKVFQDHRVEWWYRQNIVVYCDPIRRPSDWPIVDAHYVLNHVDPSMIETLAARRNYPYAGREALEMIAHCGRVLASAVWRRACNWGRSC